MVKDKGGPLRKIVEEKIRKFEESAKKEISKVNSDIEVRFLEDHIDFLTDYIRVWLLRILTEILIGGNFELLFIKNARDILIEKLNLLLVEKIDRIFYGVKLIQKMEEEINNLTN